MLKSKYANPLDSFVSHGVKTESAGDQYVLLVDETGQAVIEFISANTNTIKFAEMPNPGSDQANVIAAAIDTFWLDPTSKTYVYLFQLQ